MPERKTAQKNKRKGKSRVASQKAVRTQEHRKSVVGEKTSRKYGKNFQYNPD